MAGCGHWCAISVGRVSAAATDDRLSTAIPATAAMAAAVCAVICAADAASSSPKTVAAMTTALTGSSVSMTGRLTDSGPARKAACERKAPSGAVTSRPYGSQRRRTAGPRSVSRSTELLARASRTPNVTPAPAASTATRATPRVRAAGHGHRRAPAGNEPADDDEAGAELVERALCPGQPACAGLAGEEPPLGRRAEPAPEQIGECEQGHPQRDLHHRAQRPGHVPPPVQGREDPAGAASASSPGSHTRTQVTTSASSTTSANAARGAVSSAPRRCAGRLSRHAAKVHDSRDASRVVAVRAELVARGRAECVAAMPPGDGPLRSSAPARSFSVPRRRTCRRLRPQQQIRAPVPGRPAARWPGICRSQRLSLASGWYLSRCRQSLQRRHRCVKRLRDHEAVNLPADVHSAAVTRARNGPDRVSGCHGAGADERFSCRMIMRSLNATVPGGMISALFGALQRFPRSQGRSPQRTARPPG